MSMESSGSKTETIKDYVEIYRDALHELKRSGGAFVVERSEEVKPGVHRKQLDWKIDQIKENGDVTVLRPVDNKLGTFDKKEVDLKTFIAWQTNWLHSVQNTARRRTGEEVKRGRSGDENVNRQAGAMTEGILQKQIQKEAYEKLGITPQLLELQELSIREVTGA